MKTNSRPGFLRNENRTIQKKETRLIPETGLPL